jgi:hypothetical protein
MPRRSAFRSRSSTATRTSNLRKRLPQPCPPLSFVYPGTEHYFAEHDEQAAALLKQRVLAPLDQ